MRITNLKAGVQRASGPERTWHGALYPVTKRRGDDLVPVWHCTRRHATVFDALACAREALAGRAAHPVELTTELAHDDDEDAPLLGGAA